MAHGNFHARPNVRMDSRCTAFPGYRPLGGHLEELETLILKTILSFSPDIAQILLEDVKTSKPHYVL